MIIAKVDSLALRDTAPGEETTISYNGHPDCLEPLCFVCAG